MVGHLESVFPGLRASDYEVSSPPDDGYNCIAWAACDKLRWWWPDLLKKRYGPADVLRDETLTAFQQAFASLGYPVCAGEELEAGFEKVALFADADRFPTHATRQLNNGHWTSKLGEIEDIEHTLRDLEGCGVRHGRAGDETSLSSGNHGQAESIDNHVTNDQPQPQSWTLPAPSDLQQTTPLQEKRTMSLFPDPFSGPGHLKGARVALEAAEPELWKAIQAGGGSAAVRYEFPKFGKKTSPKQKLQKCIPLLNEVQDTLKDAKGRMRVPCIAAMAHIQTAIEELEKAVGSASKPHKK